MFIVTTMDPSHINAKNSAKAGPPSSENEKKMDCLKLSFLYIDETCKNLAEGPGQRRQFLS